MREFQPLVVVAAAVLVGVLLVVSLVFAGEEAGAVLAVMSAIEAVSVGEVLAGEGAAVGLGEDGGGGDHPVETLQG